MELTKTQIKQIEELTGLRYIIDGVFISRFEIRHKIELKINLKKRYVRFWVCKDTGELPIEWLIPLGKILEGKNE